MGDYKVTSLKVKHDGFWKKLEIIKRGLPLLMIIVMMFSLGRQSVEGNFTILIYDPYVGVTRSKNGIGG